MCHRSGIKMFPRVSLLMVVGKRIKMLFGQYKGVFGEIVEPQDENGDYGVELDGYTGTGYFKPGELEPSNGAFATEEKHKSLFVCLVIKSSCLKS